MGERPGERDSASPRSVRSDPPPHMENFVGTSLESRSDAGRRDDAGDIHRKVIRKGLEAAGERRAFVRSRWQDVERDWNASPDAQAVDPMREKAAARRAGGQVHRRHGCLRDTPRSRESHLCGGGDAARAKEEEKAGEERKPASRGPEREWATVVDTAARLDWIRFLASRIGGGRSRPAPFPLSPSRRWSPPPGRVGRARTRESDPPLGVSGPSPRTELLAPPTRPCGLAEDATSGRSIPQRGGSPILRRDRAQWEAERLAARRGLLRGSPCRTRRSALAAGTGLHAPERNANTPTRTFLAVNLAPSALARSSCHRQLYHPPWHPRGPCED